MAAHRTPTTGVRSPRRPAGLAIAIAVAAFTAIAALTAVPASATASRVAGSDRWHTAAEAASVYQSASTVWVASGSNFPDALSAGAAAQKTGSPLLLTAKNTLPGVIGQAIRRLHPSRIVLAGGSSAVSSHVQAQLESIAPVTRLAGADRYATSLEIARYAFGTSEYAYVAIGANYPDALSASAAAASRHAPVILIPGNKPATSAVRGELAHLDVTDVLIAGGSAVVNSAAASSLAAPGRTVVREAGPDRYGTSAAVAATGRYTPGAGVVVASGQNFPDALTATSWARSTRPVLLSQKTSIPAPIRTRLTYYTGACTLIGGTAVLTSHVAAQCATGSSPSAAPASVAAPVIITPRNGINTAYSQPYIIGTAPRGATITLYIDETQASTTTSFDSDVDWMIGGPGSEYTAGGAGSLQPLAAGAHTITATASVSGRTSASSAPVTFTVSPTGETSPIPGMSGCYATPANKLITFTGANYVPGAQPNPGVRPLLGPGWSAPAESGNSSSANYSFPFTARSCVDTVANRSYYAFYTIASASSEGQ